ncbi:MAG: type IV pilus assembly protein FimV [Vogesella sp.]|uniref:type IV pilus assembly protein FimV n=1 Tax=Vogesella sp. TaxID=1904252 RepID=UPI003F301E3E
MLLPDDFTLLLAASPAVLLGVLLVLRQRRAPPPPGSQLPPLKIRHPQPAASPAAQPASAQAPEPASQRLPGGPSAEPAGSTGADELQLDIGVADTDLLTEADVYLQFGYLDRAAALLRSYVDHNPPASRELARLLGLYLRLHAIDDFTEILQRLAALGIMTEADTAQAVVEGLRCDPDNLALRVFAEETLGWDMATVSRRIGLRQPASPAPPPGPLASPASPASTAGDGSLQLVCGSQVLAALNPHERMAICHLMPTRQGMRILQQQGEIATAIGTLEALLAQTRHPLTPLMDILHLYYRQANLAGFTRRLWQSFVLLGEHGAALRERLLRMGFALGSHPVLDVLASAPDSARLEALGREWGFVPPSATAGGGIPLVTVHAAATTATRHDALAEADAYLDYGQTEQALAVLEQAVFANPADVRLYPLLLDLYQRLEATDHLRALLQHLRHTLGRPPAEVATRLAQLRQFLKLDDPLEEAHVCQHAG